MKIEPCSKYTREKSIEQNGLIYFGRVLELLAAIEFFFTAIDFYNESTFLRTEKIGGINNINVESAIECAIKRENE